ncbi:aldo/keto reductase [Tropicimonas sp.]|uniref:aldo/keto reductase n=1 Tax=Tropicimonas sp. TaxID=2067044 RepID=UPI003A84D505
MDTVKLNNDVEMPIVGFGVFEIAPNDCERCVLDAIDIGYRLIDTAQAYHNEEAVGRAIARTSASREDLFITTKIWVTEHSREKALASIEESMRKLGTEYLDLLLIHQPLGDYYAAYNVMADLYRDGRLRAIGVSNFSAERLADLSTFGPVVPAVNQVETHLFFQQVDSVEWMKKYRVQHQAWGPLAQHRFAEIAANTAVCAIASAHGRTPAQVALRFNVQRGVVVIPKSVSKARMAENLDLFDFNLSPEEMETLRAMDENRSMWAAYDDPNIVNWAMG